MHSAHTYQILNHYTSPQELDPGFDVLDNSVNERPDWYEYWPIRKFLLNQTLDEKAYNRGLYFTPAMGRLCGEQYRVERKPEKIIVDGTGEMRQLRNTVFLEGSLCGCACVASAVLATSSTSPPSSKTSRHLPTVSRSHRQTWRPPTLRER